MDELIDLQNREVDPTVRQGQLEELADILHRGESHWLPYFWYSSGGALDYRIRNFYYPATVQLIKKWDHVWFDETRELPPANVKGYHPKRRTYWIDQPRRETWPARIHFGPANVYVGHL